jgi:hypothetical protein
VLPDLSKERWTRPGSAMLAAALIASLLATAAALTLIETRVARAASGESYRLARAELKAEQLLAIAVARLDSGEPLPTQGMVFTDAEDGRVSRQDADGLIDVNAAGPETLAALFSALGASGPDHIADRIADWRDEDSLRRTHGAERNEYVAAGLPPPANRPFETEGELSLVIDLNPALLACALPFLTAYSGQATPNASSAPPRLREMLALTDSGATATGAPLGRVVALSASAPLSPQADLRRTLWLRLTGDPLAPVFVHRAMQELAPRQADDRVCEAPS